MEISKVFSILFIAFLVTVDGSNGENSHHGCIHDRIAVSTSIIKPSLYSLWIYMHVPTCRIIQSIACAFGTGMRVHAGLPR